jgi:hypothetical protein
MMVQVTLVESVTAFTTSMMRVRWKSTKEPKMPAKRRTRARGSISARTHIVSRVKQTGILTGHRVTAKEIREALVKDTLVDESLGGPINHPRHYNDHPSGVECISVVRWESFNLGNAVKYIWRLRSKGLLEKIKDLKKTEFYIKDEIERLEDIAREQEEQGVEAQRR